MRTLRKYTGFLAKIHAFALIFSFLFPIATPQLSKVFAEDGKEKIKILQAPLEPIAIEGEFLVQFNSQDTLNNLKNGQKPLWMSKLGQGVSVDTSLAQHRIAHITVKNPASTGEWENLAQTLSSDPDVRRVEPNYVVQALSTTNDPLANQLWHLDKVKATQAWSKTSTKREIIVAVVDTGTQLRHEDLRTNMHKNVKDERGNLEDEDKNGFPDDYHGWNFYDGNHLPDAYMNPYPMLTFDPVEGRYKCTGHSSLRSFEMHGSHVSGIIGAVGNNNRGIVGVAPGVKIMPVKALGGPCGMATSLTVLNSVIYAALNGAHIINLSLGGGGYSKIGEEIYRELSKMGILIVAAAGNNNSNNEERPHYPSDYDAPGIISVAASNAADELAEFSNYGTHSVDLAAPGVAIMSTIPTGKDNFAKSGYHAFSGTSMAAPIVSAAAALLMANDPSLTNLQVKEKLMASVDKIPSMTGKLVSGGRLNIERALAQPAQVASSRQSDHTKPRAAPSNRPKQSQSNQESYGGIRIFDKRSGNSGSNGIEW